MYSRMFFLPARIAIIAILSLFQVGCSAGSSPNSQLVPPTATPVAPAPAPVATTSFQATIGANDAQWFVDSMGVNTHVQYMTTPYGNYSALNANLQALGMLHFRDIISTTNPTFINELNNIGSLGYTLCGLIEGGNYYPPLGTKLNAAAVVPMITNLTPTIEAVEGPNEPDSGVFIYNGVSYPQGAINESQDLWNIVKGNPQTKSLAVVAMSEASAPNFVGLAAITPPPISYATYGNMHAYQGGSLADHGLTDWYVPYSKDLTGSAILWTTEMGYHNNTKYLSNGEQQGVSARAAGIYMPIAFFSGFNQGVMRSYSYELIDELNDPNLTSGSGEGHYGLLNYDFTPKPAFTALQNLISVVKEPGQEGFTPGSLTVTFSGAPTTMQYVLLQKSNGVYYLALWNDVSVYQTPTSTTTGKDLYPANVAVNLTFSASHTFTVYAPNDQLGATTNYTLSTTSQSIKLNVPPEVLILEIQ